MNELQTAALDRLERIRSGEMAAVVYPGLDREMLRRSQDSDRIAASVVALDMRVLLRKIAACQTAGSLLAAEKLIDQAREFSK